MTMKIHMVDDYNVYEVDSIVKLLHGVKNNEEDSFF